MSFLFCNYKVLKINDMDFLKLNKVSKNEFFFEKLLEKIFKKVFLCYLSIFEKEFY